MSLDIALFYLNNTALSSVQSLYFMNAFSLYFDIGFVCTNHAVYANNFSRCTAQLSIWKTKAINLWGEAPYKPQA